MGLVRAERLRHEAKREQRRAGKSVRYRELLAEAEREQEIGERLSRLLPAPERPEPVDWEPRQIVLRYTSGPEWL